jgi:large subunit ribosomal protein L18
MIKKISRNVRRVNRHARIRLTLSGTHDTPRLCVFKSNKYIYVQIIDDELGHTLVFGTTKGFADDLNKSNIEAAKILGTQIAEAALQKGIKSVVFDRSGYTYHGKVKALAESARAAGLKF